VSRPPDGWVGQQGSGQFPMTQTQLERINAMDDLDQLAQDIATASSPFALGREWPDIQKGFARLKEWKEQTDGRLSAVEAALKQLAGGGA
jgi:hypothetical protein